MSTARRYRVIVWGPGAVGAACLRELLRRPEFEVVGVLAYSPQKNGKDVADVIGLDRPVGITVTTDKEAVIGLDADCVIWCGTIPWADVLAEMQDYVIRLLESGKHVITPVAYHYPHFHGDEYVQRLERACRIGNSCLHGTGENPGFWLERLGLTLTGLCNDVEYIRLDEYIDLAQTGSEILPGLGFGMPEDQARHLTETGPLADIWSNYFYIEGMNLVSNSLFGRSLERCVFEYKHHMAERGFSLAKANGDPVDVVVEAGTVSAQTYRLTGYLDGKPCVGVSLNWFLLPEYSPFTGKADSTWQIRIEGRPLSLDCNFQALASVEKNLQFHPGDPTSPSWYATAVPCIQAIPVVCSHPPGIVYPSTFANCTSDYRVLGSRRDVVGYRNRKE